MEIWDLSEGRTTQYDKLLSNNPIVHCSHRIYQSFYYLFYPVTSGFWNIGLTLYRHLITLKKNATRFSLKQLSFRNFIVNLPNNYKETASNSITTNVNSSKSNAQTYMYIRILYDMVKCIVTKATT